MAPMRNLVNFERHVAFKPTVVVWNALASVRRTAYAR
jgi:hypothetical protein